MHLTWIDPFNVVNFGVGPVKRNLGVSENVPYNLVVRFVGRGRSEDTEPGELFWGERSPQLLEKFPNGSVGE